MIRRTLLTSALTAALLLVTALPAFAHAGFVQASVPADSDQTLTMRVPGERAGQATVKVETQVPAGFVVDGCSAPQFTCAFARQANGTTVVTWARPTGTVDTAIYSVALHTPKSPGTYLFPTIQTYNGVDEDGHTEEFWTGELSPSLEVTGEDTEVEENTTPPPSDHPDEKNPKPTASEPAAPKQTTSPTSSDSDADAGSSSSSDAGSSGSSSAGSSSSDGTSDADSDAATDEAVAVDSEVDDTTTEGDDSDAIAGDGAATTTDTTTLAGQDEAATDEGGRTLVWVGLALVLAAGGGLVIVRRRMA